MPDNVDPDLWLIISGIRGDCVEAFAGLGERLDDVRHGLDGVGAQVTSLADLLAAMGMGDEPRDTITTACIALSDALQTSRQALERGEVMRALREAIEALEAISRQAKHLTAVSSITYVTARSTGAESLGDYVISLRQMIEDLASSVLQLNQGLVTIQVAYESVLDDVDSAGLCVKAVVERIASPSVPQGPAETDRARLEARFAGGARDLAEAAHRETAALVTAMQFSDSLAQRLEHVEQILAASAGCERVARGLAAAQLSALAEDATVTIDSLADVLARLSERGAGAAQAFSAPEGLQVEAMLAARRSALAEGTAVEAQVVPALSAAQDAAQRIQQQIDRARGGYARLTETAKGVNLSAINATLLTARGGAARAAMAVLSEAVRGSARDCTDQTANCRAAMTVLEAAVQEADFPALAQVARNLHETIERCARALDLAESDLARLASMRDAAGAAARSLMASIGAGEASLLRVAPAIDKLHAAARGLGGTTQPTDDELAVLNGFAAFYTMPREREVHALFCGQSTVHAPAATKQDLCDIFF